MMRHHDRVFLRYLSLAVSGREADALQRAKAWYGSFCFKDAGEAVASGPIPDAVWDALVGYLEDPRLQEMKGSFSLALLFQTEWARSSEEQRERLLPALSRSYPRFVDRTTCLVLAQLLGEYFGDERGLAALEELEATGEPLSRAYVAEGYRSMAREAADPAMRRAAVARLRVMARDAAPVVSGAAQDALASVGER